MQINHCSMIDIAYIDKIQPVPKNFTLLVQTKSHEKRGLDVKCFYGLFSSSDVLLTRLRLPKWRIGGSLFAQNIQQGFISPACARRAGDLFPSECGAVHTCCSSCACSCAFLPFGSPGSSEISSLTVDQCFSQLTPCLR